MVLVRSFDQWPKPNIIVEVTAPTVSAVEASSGALAAINQLNPASRYRFVATHNNYNV